MNNLLSKDIAKYSTFGMMVITVSFFLTQIYSRLFTTSDGNLIIALVILGTFLCGRTYGVTAGVILSIFVLVMRFLSHLEGFSPASRADLSRRFATGWGRLVKDTKVLIDNLKNKKGTYANLSEFQYQKAARDAAEVEYKKSRKFCGVSKRQIGRLAQTIYGTPAGQSYITVQHEYPSESIARDNGHPSKRGGKWYGKIKWNPVPKKDARTNLLKGKDLYSVKTWLDDAVVKLILGPTADLSGKTYMELIANFYGEERHCTLEPLFLKAKNASPADAPKLLEEAYKKQLEIAERVYKIFTDTSYKQEIEARKGLSDVQKKVRAYALLARDLKFNDNSDGFAQRRFDDVNKQTTEAAAKAKYDEWKKKYEGEVAANKLIKMKYAIKSRDLDFPITNSDTARKMRYETTLNMPTTGQAQWKYERDYLPRSLAEQKQEAAIKKRMEEQGWKMKKLQEELDAQKAKIEASKKQAEAELAKAKAEAAKLVEEAKKAQAEAERRAKEQAEEIKKLAGEQGAALAAKIKADAEAAAAAAAKAAAENANVIKKQAEAAAAAAKLAAEQKAGVIQKEAEAAAAAAKAKSDAERLRLEKYEIELQAERERAEAAERMAAKQRLRVEEQLRKAREAQQQTLQAGINVREELARERERRAAAEEAVFVEQKRGDAMKAKEIARCRTAKIKADTIRKRQEMIRKQKEEEKAAAERARKEAEQAEKDRLEALKRVRMRELAADKRAKLIALRMNVVNNTNLRKEEDQARQVSMSSELIAAQSRKQNNSSGIYNAGPAAQLTPNGMPNQYSIDDMYRTTSKNSYLERGKTDNLYVDRTTLGGYVGPMNYELYADAQTNPKK